MRSRRRAGAGPLGERGRRPLDVHPGKAVQTDELDQRRDLRLGVAQQDRAPVGPQAPGDHGEIEHQRRIRKVQLAQIDDDVRLGANRTREGLTPAPLRRPILVSLAAQSGRCVIEVDDVQNLPKPRVGMQVPRQHIPLAVALDRRRDGQIGLGRSQVFVERKRHAAGQE